MSQTEAIADAAVEWVEVNGALLPAAEARVSVFDRGFLFGDAVYEVIPVYGGLPFGLRAHLARLARSLRLIHVEPPRSEPEWEASIHRLVAQNGGGDRSVYIEVTRGAPLRRDHAFPPPGTAPTVVMMAGPLKPPPPEWHREGVKVTLAHDVRWQWCEIKSTNLLPNVLARQAAVSASAVEALLVREGRVLEGSASNVFAVVDDLLLTPPWTAQMLPGVTRAYLLALARAEGWPYAEEDLSLDRLADARELMLASSTRELLPATRLGEDPVGDGQPGLMWRRLFAAYQRLKSGQHPRAAEIEAEVVASFEV